MNRIVIFLLGLALGATIIFFVLEIENKPDKLYAHDQVKEALLTYDLYILTVAEATRYENGQKVIHPALTHEPRQRVDDFLFFHKEKFDELRANFESLPQTTYN